MITKISEAEARKNNLIGADVFKRTELAYKDDLNRDAFVVSLYHEAYKIFLSSVVISQFHIFKEHSRKTKEELNNGSFNLEEFHFNTPHQIWQRMEYINLENFYIATGFELFLKSRLLENDFLVNLLENKNEFKELRQEQHKRPIHKSELFSISDYFYDEALQRNVLLGITQKSLDFKLLSTNIEYRNTFKLSTDLLDIIEDYRNLRNQIHLPGDFSESTNLNRLGEEVIPLIINFINTEIVCRANILTDKHKLNYKKLEEINS